MGRKTIRDLEPQKSKHNADTKLDLEQLKAYCAEHNIKTVSEYRRWCKSDESPSCLPSDPPRYYAKENSWVNWNDLLGKPEKKFVPYHVAKQFVRSRKISSYEEWLQFCKDNRRPNHIPSNPNIFYHKDWNGWSEFLCPKESPYLSLDEAVKAITPLKIPNVKAWYQFCREGNRPSNIPYRPDSYYLDWKGWSYFLTGKVNKKTIPEFLPYDQAKELVASLNITKVSEWRELCRTGGRPENVPSNPDRTFKNKGWVSWNHFLEK